MVTIKLHLEEAFRGLADPTRREILELLRGDGQAVNEIAARFPMSRPAISKHLRLLKEGGLVAETRSGRERIYQLEFDPLEEVAAWLEALLEGRERESGNGAPGAASAPQQPDESWRVW